VTTLIGTSQSSARLSFHQLTPKHLHLFGRVDCDSDLIALDLVNLNLDIVANADGVVTGVACENQHSLSMGAFLFMAVEISSSRLIGRE